MKKTFKIIILLIICLGLTACDKKEITKYSGTSAKDLIEYFENEGFKFSIDKKPINDDYDLSVSLTSNDLKIKFIRSRKRAETSERAIPIYYFCDLEIDTYTYIDFTYELDEFDIEELSHEEEKIYNSLKDFLDDSNISTEQIKEIMDNYFNENAEQKYLDMEKENTDVSTSVSNNTETSETHKMIKLEEKLILNKYEEYDNHNWSKEEIVEGQKLTKHFNTEYKIFTLSDENGNSVGYQYGDNIAGISDCNYDFNTNIQKEGSTCSSEQLTIINNARKIFLNEMEKFGITEYN